MTRISIIFISLILLFSACCSNNEDIVGDQIDQYPHFPPITISNVVDISELSILSTSEECGKITTLQVLSARESVIGHCLGSGNLIIWDIFSQEELATHALGIGSWEGTHFSKEGNFVIGATKVVDSSLVDSPWSGESIGYIYVWDIDNISKPTCVDSCESVDEEYYTYARGTAISSDGNIAIAYYPFFFFVLDLENQNKSTVLLSQDADFSVSIGDMAIDPSNKKYAVSFLEGDVHVYRFGGLFSIIPNIVNKKPEEELIFVRSLEFSPDGKWLANITNQGINIWKVLWGKPKSISTITNPQNLVFDANSEILYIQADNSVVVYDFKKGNVISELNTPGITSITISSGNEYFAWGDEGGKIHLWGIK